MKLKELVDEMEDLNYNGEITKEAINMKVEKLFDLAPNMMKEMFGQNFEDCTADVGIDFMDVDITILAEDKYHWGNKDFDEMGRKYKDELIALMEYMKEIGQ